MTVRISQIFLFLITLKILRSQVFYRTSLRCDLSDVFFMIRLGFPQSSVGKESACNAGDPSLIPGSRRAAGEGIGYPLQDSWASLVAQLVKNPPTVWETWARSLAWEDRLEKGTATYSSILAWRIHGLYSPQGRKESDETERLSVSC